MSTTQSFEDANSPLRKLDLDASSTLNSPPPEEDKERKSSHVGSSSVVNSNDQDSLQTGYHKHTDKDSDENSNNKVSMISTFLSALCSCCSCDCSTETSGTLSQFEIAKKYFVAFYIPNIATAIGTALFATMIPVSMRDFKESDSLTGLIVSLSGVGRVIADVPASFLSHRFGPLLTMTVSVLLAGIVFALPVIDYRVWAFVAAQAVVGLPLGAFAVPRLELLQFSLPAAERNKITSHMGAGNRIAFLVGPLLGGWMYNELGGRWSYLFACLFFFIALAALLLSRDLAEMSKRMVMEAQKQHKKGGGGGDIGATGEYIISVGVIEQQRKKEKEREERKKMKRATRASNNTNNGKDVTSPSLQIRSGSIPGSKDTSCVLTPNKSFNPSVEKLNDDDDDDESKDQNNSNGENHSHNEQQKNVVPFPPSSSSSSSSTHDGHSIGTETEQQSIASHPDLAINNIGDDENYDDNDDDEEQVEEDRERDDEENANGHHDLNHNHEQQQEEEAEPLKPSADTTPPISSRQLSESRKSSSARLLILNRAGGSGGGTRISSSLLSPPVPPLSLPGSPVTSLKLVTATASSPFMSNSQTRHSHHQFNNNSNPNNSNSERGNETNEEPNFQTRDHHHHHHDIPNERSSLLVRNSLASCDANSTNNIIHIQNDAEYQAEIAEALEHSLNQQEQQVQNNNINGNNRNESIFWASFKNHWADVVCIGFMALSTTALRQGRRLVLTFRALNLDYSAKQVGLVIALSFSIDAVFFWISPMITNKFGYRAAVMPLQLLYAAAFVILSFDSSETDNSTLLISCVVFGMADVMGAGLMLSIISEQIPRPLVGMARTFVDAGLMIGSLVTGVMSHELQLSWCCRILAMWSGFAMIWAWVVLPGDAGKELERWMKQRRGGR